MRKLAWLPSIVCLCVLALTGCANEAKTEKTSEVADNDNSSDNKKTKPKSLDDAPGLKGLTGRARNKAKLVRTNLELISIHCELFRDYYSCYPFPAGDAMAGEMGNLSWRVALIVRMDSDFPEMKLAELWESFKREEPWNSEHNIAFLPQMPGVFELSDEAKPGHTQFVAPSGPGFIVDWPNEKRAVKIEDDRSTTIILVSVKPEYAEPWTKPGGVKIDPENAAEVLGGDPNGFLALFADGSIKTLDPNMDPKMLKALLTVAGGESIDVSKLPGNDISGLSALKAQDGASITVPVENVEKGEK